jgi:hypothetical protein
LNNREKFDAYRLEGKQRKNVYNRAYYASRNEASKIQYRKNAAIYYERNKESRKAQMRAYARRVAEAKRSTITPV